MAKTTNHRILNPVTATVRQIAEVLNTAMNGKINCHGVATLPSGGGDLTVTDPRAGKESTILFSPLDEHFYHHEPYVKSRANGSFVIGQQSHGHTTSIEYVIIG